MSVATKAGAMRRLDWAFPPAPVARELLECLPGAPTDRPPILFVHGLGQGAWNFAEHWLPALAERGWPAYAVSLRGHGGSGGADRLRRTLLRDYVHDVLQAVVALPRQPVLVGHSMGSLVVQHVLERYPARAGVLLAPLSPDHGLKVALGLGRRHPLDLARVLAGRALPLRTEYLFGAGTDEPTAQRYRDRMGPESPLVQYQLVLPRRPRPSKAPVLVVGSPDDGLVPPAEVAAVAGHYGTQPHWLPGLGHLMPLEARWLEPLELMTGWLEQRLGLPAAAVGTR